jgi:hypothetical protein
MLFTMKRPRASSPKKQAAHFRAAGLPEVRRELGRTNESHGEMMLIWPAR